MAQPFKYKPAYGVIVICTDEKAQKRVFEQLKKRHKKVRGVSV